MAMVLIGAVDTLHAHPMPDTEITVARAAQVVNLTIRVPMSDLLAALPPRVSRNPRTLLGGGQRELRAYFAAHTRLVTRQGATLPITIGAVRMHRERDPSVGDYAELEVMAAARIGRDVSLSLAYDGVLHRIANHRASVRDGNGRLIGVIRYSLAAKRAAALPLSGAASGRSRE